MRTAFVYCNTFCENTSILQTLPNASQSEDIASEDITNFEFISFNVNVVS